MVSQSSGAPKVPFITASERYNRWLQWLSNVNNRDRKAAKKFWKHLNSLSRKRKLEQCSIMTPQGNQLEGDEAIIHIAMVIAEKFKEQTHTGSVIRGESRTTNTLESIGQNEWKKAVQRVPSGASAGTHGRLED